MEIIATIIGGFLAAGTGWFVQSRIEKEKLRKHKALLITGITDDLNNSIDLYDKLSEEWERSRIVWFNILTELSESRHIYVNHRDSIIFIENVALRNRILQYYRKSGGHLLSLQNAQQRKYDIQNKCDLAIQNLRFQNPALEHDEAQKLVVDTMRSEDAELIYWNEQLPVLVTGLQRYKSEAREILKDLVE